MASITGFHLPATEITSYFIFLNSINSYFLRKTLLDFDRKGICAPWKCILSKILLINLKLHQGANSNHAANN